MTTDGQNLCLSCGLCCDGTLHASVPVDATEPVEALRQAGVRITPDSDGKGRYEMPQPCLRFEDGRCRTYGCRPANCSSYRCRLLRRVEAGKTTLHAAKGIVQSARERRRRTRRALDRHFPDLAGEPLVRAIRIAVGRTAGLDETGRRRFRAVHGEFLLAAASLEDCLECDFRPPAASSRATTETRSSSG